MCRQLLEHLSACSCDTVCSVSTNNIRDIFQREKKYSRYNVGEHGKRRQAKDYLSGLTARFCHLARLLLSGGDDDDDDVLSDFYYFHNKRRILNRHWTFETVRTALHSIVKPILLLAQYGSITDLKEKKIRSVSSELVEFHSLMERYVISLCPF